MRPAVNVGLSVSRVGGAAQTKAMKKASGSIRIDLAQYREMEVFTQFSSDLDEATKAQLTYGSCLMELLKQPLCSPLKLHEQVITLWAATHKAFVHVETKRSSSIRRSCWNTLTMFIRKWEERSMSQNSFLMNWEKRSFRLQRNSEAVQLQNN